MTDIRAATVEALRDELLAHARSFWYVDADNLRDRLDAIIAAARATEALQDVAVLADAMDDHTKHDKHDPEDGGICGPWCAGDIIRAARAAEEPEPGRDPRQRKGVVGHAQRWQTTSPHPVPLRNYDDDRIPADSSGTDLTLQEVGQQRLRDHLRRDERTMRWTREKRTTRSYNHDRRKMMRQGATSERDETQV